MPIFNAYQYYYTSNNKNLYVGVPQSHWNTADLPDPSQLDCGQLSQMIKDRNKQQSTTNPTGQSEKKKLENLPSFVPYNLLTQHSIPDKSIADCVEGM